MVSPVETLRGGEKKGSRKEGARTPGPQFPCYPHRPVSSWSFILPFGKGAGRGGECPHPGTCQEASTSKESEDLEKQNAALRKEIKQLTEEMKYFTSVLSSHEPLCSVLATSAPSPPEVVYSAHAFHQPHVSSPRFQP
ncbi:basic leucine zipper transcriptional factor ATF-like isoform X1 [Oryctolagus cuniculus]|uniref:basic leucine zipper transcriptional factor ATF-like isoform X1 n=1 Tax=Oryctolagus cuniculus TaxID=9986 RepID=UPI0007EE6EE0